MHQYVAYAKLITSSNRRRYTFNSFSNSVTKFANARCFKPVNTVIDEDDQREINHGQFTKLLLKIHKGILRFEEYSRVEVIRIIWK